ncbi:MAG TPA: hypothetical protein VFI04_04565 [Gaiellaceae bacterium]|jgi:hypothetical protein|nr:hypothetical protein [Gaiellaceae bacterium]
MKKLILVVALVALLAPLAALADNAPTPAQTANQLCATEKAADAAAFKNTYGTNANKANAWGKCVSGKAKAAHAAVQNAAQQCAAEQSADAAAFATKYGTNGKSKGTDKNAMGKCVSGKVHTAVTTDTQKFTNAAKACKALLKSNAADFATKYGKKANAFGKCVAAKGK